jgi:hypothetical protein
MKVRIRETGQVMTLEEFRQLHSSIYIAPGISEKELDALGADPVFNSPKLYWGETVYQYVYEDGVEKHYTGKWWTKYSIGPVFTDITDADGNVTTAAEQEAAHKATMDAAQAASVRNERNKLLADSDWTQVDDSTGVDKESWATYRQALRDLTAQVGFPWTIVWPVYPDQNVLN